MSSDDFTREPLGIGPRLKELDRQLKAADREALGNISAGLAQAISERDAARAENARLRECLEGMVWQFGHHFERDGEPYISTMGLSDLEHAFAVLREAAAADHPEKAPVAAYRRALAKFERIRDDQRGSG